MKFRLTADAVFEADDIDEAFTVLSMHFDTRFTDDFDLEFLGHILINTVED